MSNDLTPSPVRELDSRARHLSKGIEARDGACLARIRAKIPSLVEAGFEDVGYEHAKTTVAREAGFKTWPMAIDVLEARLAPGDDYGDFWYSIATDVMLNHWCSNYEEALTVHENQGGFLIPYRRHFAVVQKGYIEILGMDAGDPAWQDVHYNVVVPRDPIAYRHLALCRLMQIPPPQ